MMSGMADTFRTPIAAGSHSLPEASALIGCARVTLNLHVLAGRLPATRGPGGHWFLDDAGLAQARSMVHPLPRRVGMCSPCMRVAELLYRWDSGTVAEIAPLLGIVEGNVRKHLGHLARDGHAMRQLGGDWVLTAKGRAWMGEWEKPISPEQSTAPLDSDPSEEVSAPG
jgi:hypothetical protein